MGSFYSFDKQESAGAMSSLVGEWKTEYNGAPGQQRHCLARSLSHCSYLSQTLRERAEGPLLPGSRPHCPLCFLGSEEFPGFQEPWLLGASGQPVTGSGKRLAGVGWGEAVVVGHAPPIWPGAGWVLRT